MGSDFRRRSALGGNVPDLLTLDVISAARYPLSLNIPQVFVTRSSQIRVYLGIHFKGVGGQFLRRKQAECACAEDQGGATISMRCNGGLTGAKLMVIHKSINHGRPPSLAPVGPEYKVTEGRAKRRVECKDRLIHVA